MSIGLKILAAVLLIGALFAAKGAYDHMYYQEGWDARNAKAVADEAKVTKDALDREAQATHDALEKERGLRDLIDTQAMQRQRENKDYENRIANLQSRIAAGDVGLSIPVSRNSVSGCGPAAGAAIGSGFTGETRANLMPRTVEWIFSIAGRSARDMRDYNAVVDAYNAARATCNAPLKLAP